MNYRPYMCLLVSVVLYGCGEEPVDVAQVIRDDVNVVALNDELLALNNDVKGEIESQAYIDRIAALSELLRQCHNAIGSYGQDDAYFQKLIECCKLHEQAAELTRQFMIPPEQMPEWEAVVPYQQKSEELDARHRNIAETNAAFARSVGVSIERQRELQEVSIEASDAKQEYTSALGKALDRIKTRLLEIDSERTRLWQEASALLNSKVTP